MADITADGEDDVEKLSAYQVPHQKDPAALPLDKGPSQIAPHTMVTTREESQHGGVAGLHDEDEAAEERRQAILRRLEGEPVELEAGLKVRHHVGFVTLQLQISWWKLILALRCSGALM